jgi:hypothetical protein
VNQGSGNLGASILAALVKSSKFNVAVLTRLSSTNQYPADIRTIISDYSHASLVNAFKGQDAVISVLGAGGLGDESKVVDAAVAAGVKRFIPSQFGSNTQNQKACELLPILGGKTSVIEHLKKQEVHGMSWTGITAGLAFDWVGYFFITMILTSAIRTIDSDHVANCSIRDFVLDCWASISTNARH